MTSLNCVCTGERCAAIGGRSLLAKASPGIAAADRFGGASAPETVG